MDYEPSTNEQSMNNSNITEVSCLELTSKQELIRQLKEAKQRDEITYPRILERMEKNGKYLSLTTLRRVFAVDSELNAASFNYETTLLPIAEALLNVEDVPTDDNSPLSDEAEWQVKRNLGAIYMSMSQLILITSVRNLFSMFCMCLLLIWISLATASCEIPSKNLLERICLSLSEWTNSEISQAILELA